MKTKTVRQTLLKLLSRYEVQISHYVNRKARKSEDVIRINHKHMCGHR